MSISLRALVSGTPARICTRTKRSVISRAVYYTTGAWLASRDSNPNYSIQSAACYRYTRGQWRGRPDSNWRMTGLQPVPLAAWVRPLVTFPPHPAFGRANLSPPFRFSMRGPVGHACLLGVDDRSCTGLLRDHNPLLPLLQLRPPWCARGDSNSHARRHTALNRARLPIPPPALWYRRGDSNSHGFRHGLLRAARLPVPPLRSSCLAPGAGLEPAMGLRPTV